MGAMDGTRGQNVRCRQGFRDEGDNTVMGIRSTAAVLACGLGALAAYHWVPWHYEARQPSTYRARALEAVTPPQPAPPARSRIRLAAPLPASPRAGSEPAGSFRRLAALSLGSPVDAVAIGDVTGDGRDDVVATTHQIRSSATHPTDFKLSVFVQQDDGRLAPALQTPYPGFSLHTRNPSIVLVDLDEDGVREIVLGYGDGIHVFDGAASGQLSGRGVPDAFGSVRTLVSFDINRDDHADLVAFGGSWLRVYLGDGRGGLVHESAVSTWPVGGNNANAHMAAGDLNGDGLLDMALHSGTPQAALFVQTASGTFELWPQVLAPYPAVDYTAMAVADFDGDGDQDLMFGTSDSNRNHPHAQHWIYRQTDGKLEVATPVRRDAYDVASAMIGVDMNGDGRDDLLTVRTPVNEVVASVGYSRQQSDGNLAAEIRFPLTQSLYETSPRGLAAGDFTGDGCNDIAATSNRYLVLFEAACKQMVMSRPLPPQRVASPGGMPSNAASVRIADMTSIGIARRTADPRQRVRRDDRVR